MSTPWARNPWSSRQPCHSTPGLGEPQWPNKCLRSWWTWLVWLILYLTWCTDHRSVVTNLVFLCTQNIVWWVFGAGMCVFTWSCATWSVFYMYTYVMHKSSSTHLHADFFICIYNIIHLLHAHIHMYKSTCMHLHAKFCMYPLFHECPGCMYLVYRAVWALVCIQYMLCRYEGQSRYTHMHIHSTYSIILAVVWHAVLSVENLILDNTWDFMLYGCYLFKHDFLPNVLKLRHFIHFLLHVAHSSVLGCTCMPCYTLPVSCCTLPLLTYTPLISCHSHHSGLVRMRSSINCESPPTSCVLFPGMHALLTHWGPMLAMYMCALPQRHTWIASCLTSGSKVWMIFRGFVHVYALQCSLSDP